MGKEFDWFTSWWGGVHFSMKGTVYERGTFSAKNGTWKGKGLDLRVEPHKTMLGISNWGPCIWQNPFLLPTLFLVFFNVQISWTWS